MKEGSATEGSPWRSSKRKVSVRAGSVSAQRAGSALSSTSEPSASPCSQSSGVAKPSDSESPGCSLPSEGGASSRRSRWTRCSASPGTSEGVRASTAPSFSSAAPGVSLAASRASCVASCPGAAPPSGYVDCSTRSMRARAASWKSLVGETVLSGGLPSLVEVAGVGGLVGVALCAGGAFCLAAEALPPSPGREFAGASGERKPSSIAARLRTMCAALYGTLAEPGSLLAASAGASGEQTMRCTRWAAPCATAASGPGRGRGADAAAGAKCETTDSMEIEPEPSASSAATRQWTSSSLLSKPISLSPARKSSTLTEPSASASHAVKSSSMASQSMPSSDDMARGREEPAVRASEPTLRERRRRDSQTHVCPADCWCHDVKSLVRAG